MKRSEQHDAMREFCKRCIQASWDASIDAGDVQAWAHELGLVYVDKADRSDIEDHGFEGDHGDPIYRFERWLQRPTPLDGIDGMLHVPKA